MWKKGLGVTFEAKVVPGMVFTWLLLFGHPLGYKDST